MAEETALQTRIGTLSESLAQKYNMDWDKFLATFKATVFKSCKRPPTNEEVAVMMMVTKQYDLNPFVGQIFAFLTKGGGIVPVVGVDGFVTIAERNKDYDGFEMTESDQIVTPDGGKPCPEWMEIKIYRKNQTHPTVIREYLDEVYVPSSTKGFVGPWQTHTKRMHRHKTIVQGVRVAMAITGIYDEDEAHRIDEATRTVKVKPDFKPHQTTEGHIIDGEQAEYKTLSPVDPIPTIKAEESRCIELSQLICESATPGKTQDVVLEKYKIDTYSELTETQITEAIEIVKKILEKENA